MGILSQKDMQTGFSLIECVVVLCIMALVLWVSVPALGNIYEKQLVEQQTRLIEEQLVWLRSEAQEKECRASFRVINKGQYALSVIDGDGSQTKEYSLMHHRLSLESNAQDGTIEFSKEKTSFEKCRVIIKGKYQSRHIVVSNLGRIRVEEGA